MGSSKTGTRSASSLMRSCTGYKTIDLPSRSPSGAHRGLESFQFFSHCLTVLVHRACRRQHHLVTVSYARLHNCIQEGKDGDMDPLSYACPFDEEGWPSAHNAAFLYFSFSFRNTNINKNSKIDKIKQ